MTDMYLPGIESRRQQSCALPGGPGTVHLVAYVEATQLCGLMAPFQSNSGLASSPSFICFIIFLFPPSIYFEIKFIKCIPQHMWMTEELVLFYRTSPGD